MSNQLFAVVQISKEGNDIMDTEYFEEYDKAFDCLNEIIAEDGMQLKPIKAVKPLKVAMRCCNVELWIIKRETQLTPAL